MKRTLSFMVMALALLLTQCRKPEVKFPTPSSAEGVTVSMTVTAGPGSKTDISETGAITWSKGDKLYVSHNNAYVGCLELVGNGGSATGTFRGTLTLNENVTGGQQFRFFYLGSTARTLTVGDETVTVSFATQTGLLGNLSSCHIGYGTANGTVTGNNVTGIDVAMVSKVALARFSFKKSGTSEGYSGVLTLSGDRIYNSMTVGFGGTFNGEKTDGGEINLTDATLSEKYVMLVPAGATAATLKFDAGAGTTDYCLANGIETNKYYGQGGPIEVVLTTAPAPTTHVFSVSSTTTVEFSPGNLQYLGKPDGTGTWRFAEHQWDYMGDGPNTTTGNKGNVDLSSLGYLAGMYNTGSENAGGSETEADKKAARDLFGWGTTGCQDTRSNAHTYQTNYRPYSTSKKSAMAGSDAYDFNRFGYGPDYVSSPGYNLTVENKSDWGCVTGLPSAGEGKSWRTLTKDEWVYLFDTRTVNGGTGEGSSYQRATINSDGTGVYGLLLYPDGYTSQTGADSYTAAEFTEMEKFGVVFLPAAGNRIGNFLVSGCDYGYYWSSACNNIGSAYLVSFSSYGVATGNGNDRCNAYSVRLVR